MGQCLLAGHTHGANDDIKIEYGTVRPGYSVTFKTAFTEAPVVTIATSSTNDIQINILHLTKNGFTAECHSSTYADIVMWIAMGT